MIDLHSQLQFEDRLLKFSIPPILSTGGYNDTFLKFVSASLGSSIIKCREPLSFIVKAIDYINSTSNDCFFKLIGPVN